MRKLIILLPLFLAAIAGAQENSKWLGIRGGFTPGLEYRQFVSVNRSFKLLLGYRDRGLLLHGLFEIHRTDLFPSVPSLSLIYGPGIHAGYQSWNVTEKQGTYYTTRTRTAFVAGLDGLLALEYELGFIPLTAGLECKPYIDLGGRYGFHAIPWDVAFTLKLQL